MIFTKVVKDGKFEVREFGHNFLITKDEFVKAVETGQIFFKANKPVTERHLPQYI